MWCWGRDVRSAPNLLVAAGLVRIPSNVADGATRYAGEIDGDLRLTLWGFGLAVREAGGRGLFVHRFRRGARWLPAVWDEAVVTPNALPPMRRPSDPSARRVASALLDRALAWVERYERGVNAEHRRRTLERWEHPVVGADAMADAWGEVRRVQRRSLTSFPTSLSKFFSQGQT